MCVCVWHTCLTLTLLLSKDRVTAKNCTSSFIRQSIKWLVTEGYVPPIGWESHLTFNPSKKWSDSELYKAYKDVVVAGHNTLTERGVFNSKMQVRQRAGRSEEEWTATRAVRYALFASEYALAALSPASSLFSTCERTRRVTSARSSHKPTSSERTGPLLYATRICGGAPVLQSRCLRQYPFPSSSSLTLASLVQSYGLSDVEVSFWEAAEGLDRPRWIVVMSSKNLGESSFISKNDSPNTYAYFLGCSIYIACLSLVFILFTVGCKCRREKCSTQAPVGINCAAS